MTEPGEKSLTAAISVLEREVPDPKRGLPDPVFYYVSRSTPLVNVDLLVQDERGRTLLSWRDDPYAGKGWHVPGGIIRFKETFVERVEQVAALEIGAKVEFDPVPAAVNEIINPHRDVRGHFISLLYRCRLTGGFVPANRGLSRRDAGYLEWHASSPADLLAFQKIYSRFIG